LLRRNADALLSGKDEIPVVGLENHTTGRLTMKARISIAVCILTIVTGVFAYGQGNPSPLLGKVNIPFKFMVGKRTMPAGTYDILKDRGEDQTLLLRGVDSSSSARLMIIERLAETDPSEKHGARLVFNTVGDQKYVSEFWPADNADGYLLFTTKGAHKHTVVQEK
jgi:hypothetical protein